MMGFPYPEALRAIFYRWLPMIRYESQPGAAPSTSIAIRKEILRRRGWLATAYVRPPAASRDSATPEEPTEIIQAVGV